MLLQVSLSAVLKAVVYPMLSGQSGLGLLLRHAIEFLEFEQARGLLYRGDKQQDSSKREQYDLDGAFHSGCKNLQK
jgi:hypothetical protein